jgi:hypothetical protein
MELAILWFERRVRGVQTCDKRQTLNFSNWLKIMGGDYPSFRCQSHHEKCMCALREDCLAGRFRCFRRAIAVQSVGCCQSGQMARGQCGMCSRFHRCLSFCRSVKISFHPAECFAGVCSTRFRCRLCEERRCRNRRAESPMRRSACAVLLPSSRFAQAGNAGGPRAK